MSDEDDKSGPETLLGPEETAFRLKALAEEAYTSGNLDAAAKHAKRAHKLYPSLTGLPEMIAAFRILRTAAKPVSEGEKSSILDYYEILGVGQFSHISMIKKQYKKLAMTLHPDKNPFAASEEAFKLVGEAARVLSDRVRRKDYDARLRVALQSLVSQESGLAAEKKEEETFCAACSACRLMHKFERKFLGQNLVCPSCKKTFKAMEIEEQGKGMEKNGSMQTIRASARIKEKVARGDGMGIVEKCGLGVKRRVGRVGLKGEADDVLLKDLASKRMKKVVDLGEDDGGGRGDENQGFENGSRTRDGVEKLLDSGNGGDKGFGLEGAAEGEGEGEENVGVENGSRSRTTEGEIRDGVEMVESERTKGREEGTMTLSQIRMLAKKKKKLDDGKGARAVKKVCEKVKKRENEREENEKGKEIEENGNGEVMESGKETPEEVERDRNYEKEKKKGEEIEIKKKREEENGKMKELEYTREKRERRRLSKYGNWEALQRKSSNNQPVRLITKTTGARMDMIPVEDSDFHDFDMDRQERSFKKGQVWAVYDDKDAMPRLYALIHKIMSLNPFEVTLSWLQVESTSEQKESSASQACGSFKISDKVPVKCLNLFSHVVKYERASRQVYRIYPKKGSIWALYAGSNQLSNIVLCLSNYRNVYGLSVAYLEKLPGFRTVFKRPEIGASTVVCLRKEDVEKFSHQIPAKKLSGKELSGLDQDCWELDPAALPAEFLGEC